LCRIADHRRHVSDARAAEDVAPQSFMISFREKFDRR